MEGRRMGWDLRLEEGTTCRCNGYHGKYLISINQWRYIITSASDKIARAL